MRIIIDTHVLIWYLNGDEELPRRLIKLIENPGNDVVISIVSLWELTIKLSKEKLKIGISLDNVKEYIETRDVEILGVGFECFVSLLKLPYHHGDPFDRMLIAQAITEEIPIISVDRHFAAYPVNVIW